MASLMALAVTAPPMASPLPSSSSSSYLSFSRSLSLTPHPLSLDSSVTSQYPPLIYCGRGDKKTAKGKRFKHSFGNARPRNKNKGRGPPRVPTPPAPPRKDKFEDDEIIDIELDESLFD